MHETSPLSPWDAEHIKRSRAVAEKIVPAKGSNCQGFTYEKLDGYAEALADLLAWRALHPRRPFGDLKQPNVSHRAQSAAAPRGEKPATAAASKSAAAPVVEPSFPPLKRCPKCKQDVPRNTDHWNRKADNADGFDDYCRPCKRAYNRTYAANKKRIQAQKEMAHVG